MTSLPNVAHHYADAADAAGVPIHLVDEATPPDRVEGLPEQHRRFLAAIRFKGTAKRVQLLQGADGALDGVVLGIGKPGSGEPCGPSALLVGHLASTLPAATYRIATPLAAADARLAAISWGLGAYKFRAYKAANGEPAPRLAVPAGLDRRGIEAEVEAVTFGRDLINTPASDMGPGELEAAARALAERHGATVSAIVGDDLLLQRLPMIHAVGRASTRAPRLVDLAWHKPCGRADAPRVTLVGKGIVFDTGGLDIKPSAAMLLMKKDMGGAATALALAHMIMSAGLDVRLRVLLAIAENAISGNAFRPGDVLASRAGKTVEIGNTDAEGRLVLADALALADEEAPDTLITFSTLTGAARVALGADLPALFCDDEDLCRQLSAAGLAVGDPLWRLPLWPGYERLLDSEVADMNNVSEQPFAGAIVAGLFLRRFVTRARRFAHIDLYAWRQAPRPLGPKGGETQTARALMALLSGAAGAPT